MTGLVVDVGQAYVDRKESQSAADAAALAGAQGYTSSKPMQQQAGIVLPLMAVTLLGLIAVAALALDTGKVYEDYRRAQTAADAAALAGAFEKFYGSDATINSAALKAAEENGFKQGVDGITIQVHNPPSTGFYVSDDLSVEVTISQPSPTFFAKVLGIDTIPYTTRAVANGSKAEAEACVYIMEESAYKPLEMRDKAKLTASCGVVVNSTSHGAINMEGGSSRLTASSVSVAGGIDGPGTVIVTEPPGHPITNVPPSPDPFLGHELRISPPTYSGCTHTYNGQSTIDPGVYGCGNNFDIENTVTMNPGLYIFVSNLPRLNGGTLQGDGVTLYLTHCCGHEYKKMEWKDKSVVKLRACNNTTISCVDGAVEGVVLWHDHRVGNSDVKHELESGVNSYLEGAIYFDHQRIRLESKATMNATAAYTFLVARELELESKNEVFINSNYSGLAGGPLIKRVALVE